VFGNTAKDGVRVLGWKGPLQEGEIERAKEYARNLASELKEEKA
jgi:hypothetical protein